MAPGAAVTPWAVLIAGVVVTLRLFRWRGLLTVREPLLLILHVGYGWLALGLLLLGLNGVHEMLPAMKQKPPEEWMRKFDAIEHRFAPHARIAALLVLLSGLYIIYKNDMWDRLTDGHYWWIHLSFATPGWSTRVFGSVVQMSAPQVFTIAQKLAIRHTVAANLSMTRTTGPTAGCVAYCSLPRRGGTV